MPPSLVGESRRHPVLVQWPCRADLQQWGCVWRRAQPDLFVPGISLTLPKSRMPIISGRAEGCGQRLESRLHSWSRVHVGTDLVTMTCMCYRVLSRRLEHQ